MLLTEQLQRLFNKIIIKPIKDESFNRKIFIQDAFNKTLVIAETQFNNSSISDYKKFRSTIKQRKPIGETIKNLGYKIKKQNLVVTKVKLSNLEQKVFKTKCCYAKMQTYEFICVKNRENFSLGKITEIFNPNFKNTYKIFSYKKTV